MQNTELLQRFREVEKLPERERSVILEVLGAYLRDTLANAIGLAT